MRGQQGFDPVQRTSEQLERERAFVRRVFACSEEVAGAIVARGRPVAFPPRAVILRQQESSGAAFIVIIGHATAVLYGIGGQIVLLSEFGPGDLFGRLGDLDPCPDAEVRAVDRVETFTMAGSELVALAEAHSCIGLALTRLLLQRLRRTTTRIYERAALTAGGRVCAELLRAAREGEGLVIRPAPVVSEVAVRASTTRETASRTISMLDRRGIVSRSPVGLRIVAPQRLEEMIL
jgi:CRP/FNR family transcriptional regulator, cyclic AMP receptor protein